VACLVTPHFHIYSNKDMIKKIKYKLRVLVFTTNFFRNIYCKKIERGIIINEHRSSFKVPVTINKFSLEFNFLNWIFKDFQILIFIYGYWMMSCSIMPNEPTDKQTGRIH